LAPEDFARIVDSLLPDVVIPPADYIEEPLPSLTHGKRIFKSVSRSKRWLEEFMAKKRSHIAVFAPVMGSRSLELRELCAKDLSACSDIDGYSFSDICLQVPFAEKLSLVRHSIKYLDPSKPRYMQGASAPDYVVRAVLSGIDLFDSTYPYAVTEQGFASIYRFGRECANEGLFKDGADLGHLDMWQPRMFDDFSPLVKECNCYTCRNHHRAYIHHLLMTKEMLATVLLQVHNMHWYQQFFADIRHSIAQGTFAADGDQFLERY
ncbi:tRNA-guanine(15) transglycosylase-like protein, partial [Coemansia spiralis]